MAVFDVFYKILQPHEGGYVSAITAASIKDKGGETYKGIARNFNPDWAGWKIIDAYKKKLGKIPHGHIFIDAELDRLVKQRAKQKYWDALSLDKVKNQSLANFAADFGFNSGVGLVAKAIQRILSLKVDGIVGEKTLQAVNKVGNEKKLFDALKEYRKRIIDGTDYSEKVKDSLEDRTDSFFFFRGEIEGS